MRYEEPTTFHPQQQGSKPQIRLPDPRPMDGVGILFWGPLFGGAIIAVIVMAVRFLIGAAG